MLSLYFILCLIDFCEKRYQNDFIAQLKTPWNNTREYVCKPETTKIVISETNTFTVIS
jgi:hypothetical protein